MSNFFDLSKEEQLDFISSHIAEILYRQREEDKLSQVQFLKKYFKYNIYTRKGGKLSLSQLKRYEKNFLDKSFPTTPKKNSEILSIVENFSVLNNLYQEKLDYKCFEKNSLIFTKQLKKLGLLDSIEKATSEVFAMVSLNEAIGETYDKNFKLHWLYHNTKQTLNNVDIPISEYEEMAIPDIYKD